MEAEQLSGARDAHAFMLGWLLGEIGGVNEVLHNLIVQFGREGRLRPLLLEAFETGPANEISRCAPCPVLRVPLPTPFNRAKPRSSFLRFLFKAPILLWQLKALCRAYRIQVLNPHFIGLEYLSLTLLKRVGWFEGKLIFSFHGSDIRGLIQGTRWERVLSRFMLRGADFLVPCSNDLGEEILLLVPECAGRIVPVRNGIDAEHFLHREGAGFSLPAGFERRKFILNVGAFERKKGQDVLIRAFARVRGSHPGVALIIAGQKAEMFSSLETLLKTLGLEDDVFLLQNISRNAVATLLQTCEAFVLSSRWEKGLCGEGFAMVLLEAGAAGAPVIATRSCGVTELIEDGETGTLVLPEDVPGLARAISQTLENPGEAARRAGKLREVILQEFTWERAHAQYLVLAD